MGSESYRGGGGRGGPHPSRVYVNGVGSGFFERECHARASRPAECLCTSVQTRRRIEPSLRVWKLRHDSRHRRMAAGRGTPGGVPALCPTQWQPQSAERIGSRSAERSAAQPGVESERASRPLRSADVQARLPHFSHDRCAGNSAGTRLHRCGRRRCGHRLRHHDVARRPDEPLGQRVPLRQPARLGLRRFRQRHHDAVRR